MDLKKAILKNVSFEWTWKIFKIASILIIAPILIKHFGKYEYGLWVLIGEAASFMMLLDFGVANSISRFSSKYLALKDYEQNNEVYCTATFVFFAGACLVLLITVILLPFIPSILYVPAEYRSTCQWLFALSGLNIALVFPLRVGHGLLQSENRYDIISRYGMANVFVNLAFVLLVFGQGKGDLLVLAVFTFGLNLCTEMAIYVHARKMHPYLKFRLKGIVKQKFKEIFSLGSSSFLQTITSYTYIQLNSLFVGGLLGAGQTLLFSVPVSLVQRISPFVSKMGATFIPIASRMDAKGETEKLKKLNMLGVRYSLSLSLPIGVFTFFFGTDFLNLWIGGTGLSSQDIETMGLGLCIMIIGFALGRPHMASRSILMATNRHWQVSIGLLFFSILSLIVGVFIMKQTALGVLGVAIGFSMRIILAEGIYLPVLICKSLKINFFQYLYETHWAPILACICLILFSFMLDFSFGDLTILNFLLKMFLFACVWIGLVLFLVFLPDHRKFLLSNLIIKHLKR